jgi:hypothetical protein
LSHLLYEFWAKNITPFTESYHEIISWLGLVDIFQTFEDLESVKDKQADIKAVRKLLDGEKPKESKQ